MPLTVTRGVNRRDFILGATAAGIASQAVGQQATALGPAPGRFGAQTHYGHIDWSKDVVRTLGTRGIQLTRIRDELFWNLLEPERGVYDWTYGDRVMSELAATGARVILGFGFGNPLYDSPGHSFPDTDEARTAFADYVYAALDRYAGAAGKYPGLIAGIEVWNEANGNWNGRYGQREMAFLLAELTGRVFQRVRANSSFDGIPVLGCAAVGVPLRFIDRCFAQGIGSSIDKVVVHPYGSPEALLKEVTWLRDRLDENGHEQAIWATEFGNLTSADDMVKTLAAAAAAPLEVASYYLSKSDDQFASGLMDARNHLTRVGQAWMAWADILSTSTFIEREDLSRRLYSLRFRTADGSLLRVCWSRWGTARLAVSGAHVARDALGRKVTTQQQYDVDEAPLILVGDAVLASAAGDRRILAEAFDDFDLSPGRNGWSYHARTGGRTEDMEPGYGNDRGTSWGMASGGAASLTAHGAHAGVVDKMAVEAVRRWTATCSCTAALSGAAIRGADGDGVDVSILRNGEPVFVQHALQDGTAEFEVGLDIVEGDHIDFVTAPRADQNFDFTRWNILISTAQPEAALEGAVQANQQGEAVHGTL